MRSSLFPDDGYLHTGSNRMSPSLFLCFVLFCSTLSPFVLFCFVLFCFVLFCFVLFCFVLFCFVLFYFILFYFTLLSLFILTCHTDQPSRGPAPLVQQQHGAAVKWFEVSLAIRLERRTIVEMNSYDRVH